VLLAAAKNRDATKLMDAAGGLDQVCEACHIQFWYPEQPVAGQ
jgi:cytochrome c556